MTKINVSEIEGAALDWAVAEAIGARPVISHVSGLFGFFVNLANDFLQDSVPADGSLFRPSTDWSQGGPLIDQLSVAIDSPRQTNKDRWQAQCWDEYSFQVGPTPLIAAMRAIVAAEIGDTIDVPEELLC